MASGRRRARREQQKKTIMTIVIAGLMLLSMFGIWATSQQQGSQNTLSEYGVDFELIPEVLSAVDNTLQAEINGQDYEFIALPSDTLRLLPTEGDIAGTLASANTIIYTYNPYADSLNLQFLELVRFDLAQSIAIPAINAVSQEHPQYMMPVLSCENATVEFPVVEFIIDDEAGIVVSDSCIEVRANTTDFLVARDRLIFEYLGVFEQGIDE